MEIADDPDVLDGTADIDQRPVAFAFTTIVVVVQFNVRSGC